MKKLFCYVLSFIFIFLIWQLLSSYINASIIFPTPKQVILRTFSIIQTKNFWHSFIFTFLRVLCAFLLSIIIGVFLGILSSLSHWLKYFFEVPISIIRSTPVIAIILLTLFWCNSDFVPVFVAVLMCFPLIMTAVIKGFCNCDKNRIFMAQSYNLSKIKIFRYVKIPQVIPYFLQSLESCFGMAWKVVVAGEVLSLPKYAIGTTMNLSQIHLEIDSMMSVTVVLVVVNFMLQKIVSLIVSKSLS